MRQEPPEELCPRCHRVMQVANTVYDGDRLVSVQYVCGCSTPAFWLNKHPFTDKKASA